MSKEEKQAENSKWKYMSPPGIEPTVFGFFLDRSAIEIVFTLFLKLLQYSEVTGNAGGNSGKIDTRQYNAMYQIDYCYIFIATEC